MERVVCVDAIGVSLTEGKEYDVIPSRSHGSYVGIMADNGVVGGYWRNRFMSVSDPIESPIRTVTRREVAYGDYGRVKVKLAGYNGDSPSHKRWVSLGDFGSQDWNADELRSAAMVLSQLAEFLDEDKGDE